MATQMKIGKKMKIGKQIQHFKGIKNQWNFVCPKHSLVTPKFYTRGLGEKLLMILSKEKGD